MAFELERVLYETEDFLLKTLRSGSVRQARKRRMKRKFDEALRRVRRAAWLFAGLLLALIGASLVIDIGFLTWLVAIPTAFLLSFLSLFWSARPPVPSVEAAALPLGELAVRAADGLVDRCDELPGRALPAAEAVIARLHELAPHLATLEADSIACGDARRLICQHLPRLVDSYLDLPPSVRSPGSESSQRFTESLNVISGELGDLLDRCCRDRQLSFDTQHRFIETRYGDDGVGPA